MVQSPPASAPSFRGSSPRATRGSQAAALQWASSEGGREGGRKSPGNAGSTNEKQEETRGEVVREKARDGPRLCCPQCGYDLLEEDVVDVPQEEEVNRKRSMCSFLTK